MEKTNLEDIFNELDGTFDIEEPRAGHEARFLQKLHADQNVVVLQDKKRGWWKPLSIAASIIILLSLGLGLYNSAPTKDEKMAKISPEASKMEFYFANLIKEQVKELKKEDAPEAQKIIEDTMLQLKTLETDYRKMEQDLLNGGNSKLILGAMITNFQTRIALLQDVQNQIETIKSQNNKSHENTII